jgi:CRP/FNR family transcriptional regulator, cyclic AMP receptor protein
VLDNNGAGVTPVFSSAPLKRDNADEKGRSAIRFGGLSGVACEKKRSDVPLSLEDKVRLQSMVDVFEPLLCEELEEVALRARDTHLERGDVLGKPQEEGDEELYVLKEGRVQLYVEIPNGGGEVTLSVVEGGSIFGELALGGLRSGEVYARALVPSLVCSLKTEGVQQLIESNPRVGIAMVRLLSERLRTAEVRLAELAYQQVPARLANLILRLSASEGIVSREGVRIDTPYTHRQLGTMIGANREAVTRAMTELREEGAVEVVGRRIHIKDHEALERAAEARSAARSLST